MRTSEWYENHVSYPCVHRYCIRTFKISMIGLDCEHQSGIGIVNSPYDDIFCVKFVNDIWIHGLSCVMVLNRNARLD